MSFLHVGLFGLHFLSFWPFGPFFFDLRTVFDSFWPFLAFSAVFGPFWPFLALGLFLVNFGRFLGLFFVIFGRFWPLPCF